MELTKTQVFKLYEAVGYKQGIIDHNINKVIDLEQAAETVTYFWSDLTDPQLILRTSDDMATKENIQYNNEHGEVHRTIYLLSIGVDLFGAIEKGWAVRRNCKK
jgi:hypothetical protein